MKIISTTCDGLKIGVIKEVLESFPSTNTPPQNGLKPQSLLSTPQNADLSKQPRVMFTQMPIKEMLIGKQTREIKVNVLDVSRLDQNEITVCENNKENLLFYEEINDLIDKYVQEHPNNGNYEPT